MTNTFQYLTQLISNSFISENRHATIKRQTDSLNPLLEIMFFEGVVEGSQQNLSFVFYQQIEEAADGMLHTLPELGFSDVRVVPSVHKYCITGKSPSLAFNYCTLGDWIIWMNQIAAFHNAEFGGWSLVRFQE